MRGGPCPVSAVVADPSTMAGNGQDVHYWPPLCQQWHKLYTLRQNGATAPR
jgi:hypothetical protein